MRNHATLLGLLALPLLALAGPLTPPPGPVAPTAKPLAEVEPRIAINATNTPGDADSLFKITQPGSYYLTGNITGVAGKHGIEIAQWGVTLDLNGFELDGFVAGTLDGITISVGGPRSITVMNGSVREWDGNGVDLSLAVGCRVEGLIAANNTGDGITTGSYGVVERCVAYNNDGKGIIVGTSSSVTHCTAVSSGSNGISLGSDSSASDCVSTGSGANGMTTGSNCVVTRCAITRSATDGIRATNGTMVIDCVIRDSGLDGIDCSDKCVIRGNVCVGNGTTTSASGGAGIRATGSGNRIEGNQCSDADRGIDVDVAGNFIIRNTCRGNTINWTIAADNVVGAIINRQAPGSAAISGDSAPDSTGSSNPNANFTY
jgi:parallel beta-helix repeat protein